MIKRKAKKQSNKTSTKSVKAVTKPAPKKALKKKTKKILEVLESGLTLQEEKFCKLYATDREFFGNGVAAYTEAFAVNTLKPNWYNVAKSSACRLLTKVDLLQRISELLTESGFNNQHMDKQLLFVATQCADLKSKVAAIREFNRVTKRVEETAAVPTSFEIIIKPPNQPKNVN